MRWMVPESALNAVQLRTVNSIVDSIDENHWVKGFAGSGKTIVLTHVLERLTASRQSPKICFATFTHALKDLVESGLSETAKRKIAISTFDGLKNVRGYFDVIIADEMQDIKPQSLKELQLKTDVLIVAADHDQSIYGFSVPSSALNSAIKPSRNHQLHEIERINQNVFEIATTIYSDVKVVTDTTIRHDDEETQVYRGSSKRDEFVTMFDEAVRVSAKEQPSAILLPTKTLMDEFIQIIADEKNYRGEPPSVKLSNREDDGTFGPQFEEINSYLTKNKSPLQVFGGGGGDLYEADRRKMVFLMTYHSAKGLDFKYVFLPHLTQKTSVNAFKGGGDTLERRLFFVGATRARTRLYLSYHGEPHKFLDEISDDLTRPFRKQKRTY
jgi:superfamily I DNA/RNA helicase